MNREQLHSDIIVDSSEFDTIVKAININVEGSDRDEIVCPFTLESVRSCRARIPSAGYRVCPHTLEPTTQQCC